MKFTHVTFAALLIIVSALLGVVGYLVYENQQEMKLLCVDLENKVHDLESRQLSAHHQ